MSEVNTSEREEGEETTGPESDGDDDYIPDYISNDNNNNNNNNTNNIKTRCKKRKWIDNRDDICIPLKKKRKKNTWSEKEEKRFREGLELFGRDWKSVSKHVGNGRNPQSIRSHSQIYFLRLLQTGKPLPNKVKESGIGYTLSGQPLNKYSSTVEKVFNSPSSVPNVDGVISDEEAAHKARFKRKNGYYKTNKFKIKKKKNIIISIIKKEEEEEDEEEEEEEEEHEEEQEEEQHIIEIDNIYNDAPYQLHYCPNSLLVAELHSHLTYNNNNNNNIGLLIGEYDKNKHIVSIKKCYPLNENNTNIIYSISLYKQYYDKIYNELKLSVIGWYKSGPQKSSDLLIHDKLSQYQLKLDNLPFIGLIISSWYTHKIKTDYTFFDVIKSNNDNKLIAQQFNTKKIVYNDISDVTIYRQMETLIRIFTDKPQNIIDLGRKWNNNNNMSYIDKLFESLLLNMDCDQYEKEIKLIKKKSFIQRLKNVFNNKSHIWWQTNPPLTE